MLAGRSAAVGADADSQAFRPVIEVSGGLSESNIAQYAIAGVDILSVGSLTHWVKSADFSLLALNLAKS